MVLRRVDDLRKEISIVIAWRADNPMPGFLPFVEYAGTHRSDGLGSGSVDWLERRSIGERCKENLRSVVVPGPVIDTAGSLPIMKAPPALSHLTPLPEGLRHFPSGGRDLVYPDAAPARRMAPCPQALPPAPRSPQRAAFPLGIHAARIWQLDR